MESLGRNPFCWKKPSVSCSVCSAVFAMAGTASARAVSCLPTNGTRMSAASTTSPSKSKNEPSIASPRGMSRESQRTGNESTRASAKPPTTVVSTLDTYQTTSPIRASTARIKTVRTRFEIRIGVGWAVTSGSVPGRLFASPPVFSRIPRILCISCFMNCFTCRSPCLAPGGQSYRPRTGLRAKSPGLFETYSGARDFSTY